MAKSLSRYALLTGRPGGQTQIGGTATGEHLTLKSNTLGDGLIKFGDNIVVDEANTRLGIGTTSPGSTLVVQSSADLIASFRTTGSSVDSILKISVANNDLGLNRAYTWYQVEDAATNWYTGIFKNNTDGNESFSISSTGNNLTNSQFVINKSGLVGVGPSNPLEKLDVAGNAQLRNSTTATNFYVHNNYTNSTTYERLRVGWASNVAVVGTEKGSVGGTARDLRLFAASGTVDIGDGTVETTINVNSLRSGTSYANLKAKGTGGSTKGTSLYLWGGDGVTTGGDILLRPGAGNSIANTGSILLKGSDGTDIGSIHYDGTKRMLRGHNAQPLYVITRHSGANTSAGDLYLVGENGATHATFASNGGSIYIQCGAANSGGGGGTDGAIYFCKNTTELARWTSTGLLTFGGGVTNLFPALKRSTTILQARLADDSGYATLQGKLRTDANAVAETITPTHTLTLYDAAGVAYKVPAVAA